MDEENLTHALSVVPHRSFVNSREQIRWFGSISPKCISRALPLANQSNVHEYKPAFTRVGSELHCYVAGPDSRDQVIRAWHLLGYGTLETVSDESKKAIFDAKAVLSSGLLAMPERPQNLLFGRLESFMIAAQIARLLQVGELTISRARQVFTCHERSILGAKWDDNEKFYLMDHGRKIQPPIGWMNRLVSTGFVKMTSIPSLSLLVVNLPWGPALAQMYAETLSTGFDYTFVVGGVGSCRDNLGIEEVFVADSLADPKSSPVPLENALARHAKALNIPFTRGFLRSVYNSLEDIESHPTAALGRMPWTWKLRTFGVQQGRISVISDVFTM